MARLKHAINDSITKLSNEHFKEVILLKIEQKKRTNVILCHFYCVCVLLYMGVSNTLLNHLTWQGRYLSSTFFTITIFLDLS